MLLCRCDITNNVIFWMFPFVHHSSLMYVFISVRNSSGSFVHHDLCASVHRRRRTRWRKEEACTRYRNQTRRIRLNAYFPSYNFEIWEKIRVSWDGSFGESIYRNLTHLNPYVWIICLITDSLLVPQIYYSPLVRVKGETRQSLP